MKDRDNNHEAFYPVYIERGELNALLNRDMSDKEWDMMVNEIMSTLDYAVEQIFESVVNHFKPEVVNLKFKEITDANNLGR